MRGLAAFVLSGRLPAVLVAAALALLSALWLPPAGYLAAAVVGLVTLRSGWLEGLGVGAGAGLLVAGFLALLGYNALPFAVLVALLWVPVWLLAEVLRRVPSQGLVMTVAAGVGMGAVLLMHTLPGSPVDHWLALLEGTVVPALSEQGITIDPEVLQAMAQVMTGVVVAAAILGASLSLFIARWWQALLYNPGGFGAEFRRLRVHRGVSLATVGVLVALAAGSGDVRRVAAELLLVAVVVFTLQGLAVAHARLGARSGGRGWLVALYAVLLLVWPYPLLVLGAVGLVDTWVDFRPRGGGPRPPSVKNDDA